MNEHTIDSIRAAWSEEYRRKGIPSSFRTSPTQVIIEFVSWIKQKGLKDGAAADIGCGQGRNSFYLAKQGFHVTAIDLLRENIEIVAKYAQFNNLPISAYAQNVASKWPVISNTLDIAVDIFCYKHIVEKEGQKQYRNALWEALKPEGYFLLSLASENDGFYGPLLQTSTNPKEKLIIDPYSNISSFLYSQMDLSLEFSDLFELLEAQEKSSVSPMYGKEYQRKVLNVVFRKRL